MSSSQCARVVVDELVRHGVRDVVLAPGSRSAPLAYALVEADRAGLIRLHVRVDERSAGFLALGLAKATRIPAPIVTTSGTAVANLHPAVLEAHHAAVPMLVLSADRPLGVRLSGGNQTTAQAGLFGSAARLAIELSEPATGAEVESSKVTGWRAAIARAWASATGATGGVAGPAQVNIPLVEPLLPDECPLEPGRADGAPWVSWGAAPEVAAHGGAFDADGAGELTASERSLVIIGDLPTSAHHEQARAWAHACGWPVISEPFGQQGTPRNEDVQLMPSSLLQCEDWLDEHTPEQVVVMGRPTLSRSVGALLKRPGVTVVAITATGAQAAIAWADPSQVAQRVYPWSVVSAAAGAAPAKQRRAPSAWLEAWQQAAGRVRNALAPLTVAGQRPTTGSQLAAAIVANLPEGAQLFLGSSNCVRDVDLALAGLTREPALTIYANRGLAGIDGCLATAAGLALSSDEPTYALVGDLTFFHDANGLLLGPREPAPKLTIIVANDHGGGIFSTLEYGDPARAASAADFERIFGTPVDSDVGQLARAHGARHLIADSTDALASALTQAPVGITVVEVLLDRAGHRSARAELSRAAQAAVNER